MTTRNRTRIVLTLAAVAMAILALTTASASAQTIVYQDNYDNDGIDVNTGIGGGAVSMNTSPAQYEWAEGWWVDDGNLTMSGSGGWGGISGGSYSMNGFTMPGGFRLEVTYNALSSQDRFTMGLMEEAGTEDRAPTGTQPWPIGYLATSGASTFEGIYFNAFAYDSRGRFPDAPGLQLADGTGMVQLGDEQTRDTGEHTLVLEMDADSNWSYCIDGAPATTGTIGGDGFDLSKSYHFITRNQPRRASQIFAVTLQVPTLGAAWNGGADDWAAENWDDGSAPPLVGPDPNVLMTIDAAAGDSVVTVAADFTIASGTGPAGSVAVGETNAAVLIVNDAVTLGVTEAVTVGGFGTLTVDGTLTAGSLTTVAGSTLSGNGTISANVAADGIISPGSSSGLLTFQADVALGLTAVYQCEIGQWDSDNVPDPWNPVPPTGPVNDMIHATTGELLLDGTLQLTAIEKLSPPHEVPGQPGVMVEWYGNQTRQITGTGGENSVTWEFAAVPPAQPEVYDLPGTGNWGQGHIDRGVFLTRESLDAPVIHPGITYDVRGTQVHLFQAADGDTNGDRTLGSLDIQAILSANSFPDVQPADWPQGDFTGDGWCNGLDIQAILSTGLYPFLPGPYAAIEPGQPLDGVVDLLLYPEDVTLDDGMVVPAGTVMIDPDGLVLNGYVLRSEAGIFTGAPAQQLNWFFVEDTDRQVSGNMGAVIGTLRDLGPVIGPQWTILNPLGKQEVNPFDDLTLTYTVVGKPGTFVGNLIIVPEPSTPAMLLGTGALGLLWLAVRRRRTQ